MREAQAAVEAASDAVSRFEKGHGSYETCDLSIRSAIAACTAASEAPELQPQQRQRLSALQSECDSLSQSAHQAAQRYQRRAQSAGEREQLRNRTTHQQAFEGVGYTSVGGSPVAEDYLGKERDSLQHVSRDIARMAEESSAVLDALRSQRRRMEGTRGNLEGVLQSLGVSDQAIRQIRNMNQTDAVIVAVGVALLLILMLYLWFA